MRGEVWVIYRGQEIAFIHGDDGLQLTFRISALSGMEFSRLRSGQRVSYRIQVGGSGSEAVNVHPESTSTLAKGTT
jgi:cold shock CspA family protein